MSKTIDAPRPHAKIIKAWLDGGQVQFSAFRADEGKKVWVDVAQSETPNFYPNTKYRIKNTVKVRLAAYRHGEAGVRIMALTKEEDKRHSYRGAFIGWASDWMDVQIPEAGDTE